MRSDSDPDDAALLREDFAALFDRHAPHIHRYLSRRLGDQAADDLVAETFLTAFRRRASFRADQRDARPWLYGIATLLVAQHRRDEVRRLRLHRAVPAEPDTFCHADRVAAVAAAGIAAVTVPQIVTPTAQPSAPARSVAPGPKLTPVAAFLDQARHRRRE